MLQEGSFVEEASIHLPATPTLIAFGEFVNYITFKTKDNFPHCDVGNGTGLNFVSSFEHSKPINLCFAFLKLGC